LIALITAAGALSACQGPPAGPVDHVPTQRPALARAPATPPGGDLVYDPSSDELRFVFDGLGAAVTIPRRWQQGDVSVEPLRGADDSGSRLRRYGVRFHPLALDDSRELYYLGLITVYDEAAWSRQTGTEHGHEIALAHLDGKVYTYATPQSNAPAGGTAEAERFDELMISLGEAPAVLVLKKFPYRG